jgi:hypothetical protein
VHNYPGSLLQHYSLIALPQNQYNIHFVKPPNLIRKPKVWVDSELSSGAYTFSTDLSYYHTFIFVFQAWKDVPSIPVVLSVTVTKPTVHVNVGMVLLYGIRARV